MAAQYDAMSPKRYEFANGIKPRGVGAWAFKFTNADGGERIVFLSGTYTIAKRKAMRWANELGVVTVGVCS